MTTKKQNGENEKPGQEDEKITKMRHVAKDLASNVHDATQALINMVLLASPDNGRLLSANALDHVFFSTWVSTKLTERAIKRDVENSKAPVQVLPIEECNCKTCQLRFKLTELLFVEAEKLGLLKELDEAEEKNRNRDAAIEELKRAIGGGGSELMKVLSGRQPKD